MALGRSLGHSVSVSPECLLGPLIKKQDDPLGTLHLAWSFPLHRPPRPPLLAGVIAQRHASLITILL